MFAALGRIIFGLIIISMMMTIQSRQIEVPGLQDYNPINVKLGLTKQIRQPDFYFSKVYKRQVQKVDSNSIYRFAPCIQNRPEVQFQILDQIMFSGIPKRPNVITDFNDIKYSQFLLDIYYEDLKIYVMFKNKKVAVITLQRDDQIADKILFDIDSELLPQYLETGYFIKVDEYLLFVNKDFTIHVEDQKAAVMHGYSPTQQFGTVISLQNSTFAVLQNFNGITVYYFNGQLVKKVRKIQSSTIIPSTTVKPELQDLAWWKQQKKLLVLDRKQGIKTLQLTFKFDPQTLPQTYQTGAPSDHSDDPNTSNNTDIATRFMDVVITGQIAQTDNCRLMYLHNLTLYVYCGTMTTYSLDKWPLVKQNKLPFPNIEVKQVYQIDGIIAFVGRNLFSILYLGRLVNYYEDGNLDKLIFFKDSFISANEQGVDIGKYNIIRPYITCYTEDQSFMGLSHLQFKTYAQCNDTYFEQYQVNKTMLGEINDDDTCVYTVYKSINYWKVGEVKTYPFLFATLGTLIVGLTIIIVFISKKVKMNRVIAMIQQYSKVNNDSAKPTHFVEQMEDGDLGDKKNYKNQQERNENKDKDVKKPSQIQLGQKMYDI